MINSVSDTTTLHIVETAKKHSEQVVYGAAFRTNAFLVLKDIGSLGAHVY